MFDGPGWLQSGARSGIGTDSNVMISAAAELRAMEYAQRLARRGRNMWAAAEGHSTGRALFDAALAGGAQALGTALPGLQPGAAADVVALAADHPALVERRGNALLDGWIFGAASPAIAAVWTRGRQVVADGQHVARTSIAHSYRQALKRSLA